MTILSVRGKMPAPEADAFGPVAPYWRDFVLGEGKEEEIRAEVFQNPMGRNTSARKKKAEKYAIVRRDFALVLCHSLVVG
jgi:hypothetical protein